MLRSLKDMEQYTVGATDGDVGNVVDFFLDDERWVIRYLIVNTGGLFDGRHVLISPISFGEVGWPKQRFNLGLTVDKIKNSPNVDTDRPVSRQHEREYFGHYGYSHYWDYSGLWGTGNDPRVLAFSGGEEVTPDTIDGPGDIHLRSARELRGYHIQGSDDSIGHVADFIVDDQTWEVRYLVVDTRNWWFGKKVLIAPHWANRVSWEERKVFVNLSRRAIKDSPEWCQTDVISRHYEERLHTHYGRRAYWDDGARRVRVAAPSAPSVPGGRQRI
jgi:uncharacterized protein YrrD